jgi:serine/threonine-protein kinase
MLTESEKRAAKLAVSRYGVDRDLVKQASQVVLQAHAQGKPADLLETLVAQQLLTSAQANELRQSLDSTHFDPDQNAEHDGHVSAPAPEDLSLPFLGVDQELRSLGDFRLLRRLGEGGMSAVYLAYHESEARQVAIKVLPDHLASSQQSLDRFYREARSGALLNHPNIVRGITVGQDRATGKHYLVLEFVDGPSAHVLLNRFGRLMVGDAVHIILDIARALEHAHSRNVVHRDIKPDNILLTQSGVAKLSDLGLAKRTDEASHLTAARQGFGTPYYMPYEQAMNAKYADGRSDIYALGATLYHLVTGEVPFPGDNHLEVVDKKNLGFFPPASSINPQVPKELDDILDKMLARDPRDRYQTASELIVDLERSNLAAAVPSFVDPNLALQDPVVRERLTAPAQPTCPDLQTRPREQAQPSRNGNPDLWYLRYKDRHGQWCKARATTQQVVQRLRQGQVPAEVEASHQSQSGFRPLAAYPEFREAIAQARRKKAPLQPPTPPRDPLQPASDPETPLATFIASRWGLLLAGLLGLGVALLLGVLLHNFVLTP